MCDGIEKKSIKIEHGQMYVADRLNARRVIEEKPERVYIGSPSCLSPLSALTVSLMCSQPPKVSAWGSKADILCNRTQAAVLAIEAESEKTMPLLAEMMREYACAIVDKLANPNICT